MLKPTTPTSSSCDEPGGSPAGVYTGTIAQQFAQNRPASAPPRPPQLERSTLTTQEESSGKSNADERRAVENEQERKCRHVGERYISGLEPSSIASSRFQYDHSKRTDGATQLGEYVQPGTIVGADRLKRRAIQRWRFHPLVKSFGIWLEIINDRKETSEFVKGYFIRRVMHETMVRWADDAACVRRMRRVILRLKCPISVAGALARWREFPQQARTRRKALMLDAAQSWRTPELRWAFLSWFELGYPYIEDEHENCDDEKSTNKVKIKKEKTINRNLVWDQNQVLAKKFSETVDHEEGLVLQNWDSGLESQARVGFCRIMNMECLHCLDKISLGHPLVYHMDKDRYHLSCFPFADRIQYLSAENMDSSTMSKVDDRFGILEYFVSGSRGYAYNCRGGYIYVNVIGE